MSSSYGPHEDRRTVLLEKTLLHGNIVAFAGYGVQLVLYVWCVQYLWSQRKRGGKVVMFLMVHITILITLESMSVASGVWMVEDMYINSRNYPGGPWAYFLATQNQPVNVLFDVSTCLLTFLSDLLVIWRCWVIWNSSGKLVACAVIAFPTALLLASAALATAWVLQASQSTHTLYNSASVTFGTAYTATSVGVNVLATIMITIRLFLYRRLVMNTLPPEHATHYISIATIVTESATLYSVSALGFMVSYAIKNPLSQIFMSLASVCQQIAGYLIIIRLAQGRAWNSSTLTKILTTEPQLTTVQYSVLINNT